MMVMSCCGEKGIMTVIAFDMSFDIVWGTLSAPSIQNFKSSSNSHTSGPLLHHSDVALYWPSYNSCCSPWRSSVSISRCTCKSCWAGLFPRLLADQTHHQWRSDKSLLDYTLRIWGSVDDHFVCDWLLTHFVLIVHSSQWHGINFLTLTLLMTALILRITVQLL